MPAVRRAALSLVCLLTCLAGGATARADVMPPIRHVFVIVLENKDYDESFGPTSAAPYLAKTLTTQG